MTLKDRLADALKHERAFENRGLRGDAMHAEREHWYGQWRQLAIDAMAALDQSFEPLAVRAEFHPEGCQADCCKSRLCSCDRPCGPRAYCPTAVWPALTRTVGTDV